MAASMIEVTIIVPPMIRARLSRRKIVDSLRRFNTEVKRDFDRTMATWDKHPTFKKEAKFTAGVGTAKVSVVDKVYSALDGGTKVRWALLSKDWRSKTRPGFIGSGPGAGRVLFRGRMMKLMGLPPGPSIKPRGWSTVIAKKFEPIFEEEMEKVVHRAINEVLNLG